MGARAEGMPEGPRPGAERLRGFWYQIGHGHLRGIFATDEAAARAAVLAAEPQARGQRVTITAMPQPPQAA